MSDRRKLPPQTVKIDASHAKWDDLLSRVSHGESFEITRDGQTVGRLLPALPTADRRRAQEAASDLLRLGEQVQKVSRDEIVSWVREGRKY